MADVRGFDVDLATTVMLAGNLWNSDMLRYSTDPAVIFNRAVLVDHGSRSEAALTDRHFTLGISQLGRARRWQEGLVMFASLAAQVDRAPTGQL